MPREPDPNDAKNKRERQQTDDTDRPIRGSQSEKNDKGYTDDAEKDPTTDND